MRYSIDNSKNCRTNWNLIGDKISNKITSTLKRSSKELHSKELFSNEANN